MTPRHKPTIAVVGSSAPQAASIDMAREVGRRAVEAGFSIVTGGFGGVMAAASEGAQQAKAALVAGGAPHDLPQVVAVLPTAEKQTANPHVDIVIPTGIGYARNMIVVLAGDGVIAVEGGSGTLSEIAYAWQLGRPVAALAPSGGWAARLAGESLDTKRPDRVFNAESAAAAVDYLAGEIRGRSA